MTNAPLISALAALGLSLGAALPASAQQPLSASDWLSGSIQAPPRESSGWRPDDERPSDAQRATPGAPPVAETGAVGKVAVSRLDETDPDRAGTISARAAGLPANLWAGSDAEVLASMIDGSSARLPATNALLRRILTAQLTPPTMTGEAERGRLFLARADRLLDMGANADAARLLVSAGQRTPESFRRLFDVALLAGEEGRACSVMNDTPGIAPSFGARIFCLAQSGDWSAAAITFHGAERFGLIPRDRLALLAQFLDDSYVDAGETLEPPQPVTPLDFRMHEAVGQPLPTAQLPLAFGYSDLRSTTGWKARLEAAERLSRAGTLPAQQMALIYSEQKPAASGGVWERVGAYQRLQQALDTADAEATGKALIDSFDEFARAGMAGVLASLVAADLPSDLNGRAGEIAGWLQQWQGLPTTRPVPPDPALAGGQASTLAQGDDRHGEAVLEAIAQIDSGLDGDKAQAAKALASLRALGLTAEADLAQAQLTLAPLMDGS
ncbi:hypothetical protein [Paracoccus tegillarcae]|uniref:Chemotaxis protein MotC n=1 Tax=Paracoccus tegillarcae TaxID=1529068 RepID=A0A2K9F4E4_9RHOB|nr:hypothetical protein [Paracoccus tegillarcae]AUH34011.1 hypothetical protein CUV01_11960 [Paracoccus tegillarcae]